ncbi:MAG TPA: methylenetetrahydrofolate reductase [Trueperaceae bacterium]|nr:methylenetetrahydrofolate reductase [Trueperaceae bacterium]
MRVSIELVPRSEAALAGQLQELAETFPFVDTVNLPDILRFPVRSWEGCAQVREVVPHAIPHLRAMDVDLDRPLRAAPWIERHGIDEVLVISGDAPSDMSHSVYGTSPVQVIRKLKRELPGVRVYAALDPYRQSLRREREYALQKLEAGADGLFTQPFFDLRLLEVVADLMGDVLSEGVPVFWGFTSVVGKRSARYWETRNGAIFPPGFDASLAWSRELAREALTLARRRALDVYFMPIRIGPRAYLEGILEPARTLRGAREGPG